MQPRTWNPPRLTPHAMQRSSLPNRTRSCSVVIVDAVPGGSLAPPARLSQAPLGYDYCLTRLSGDCLTESSIHVWGSLVLRRSRHEDWPAHAGGCDTACRRKSHCSRHSRVEAWDAVMATHLPDFRICSRFAAANSGVGNSQRNARSRSLRKLRLVNLLARNDSNGRSFCSEACRQWFNGPRGFCESCLCGNNRRIFRKQLSTIWHWHHIRWRIQ